MAGIPDYSTTPSDNTAVGGISIAEGWAPSSVNNAIRALMADVAKFTQGGAKVAEVTVASASTCNILGAASDLIAISGTTTITSLGTGTNRLKFVRFTDALTLTHNGTSLILPGGANITTAAGDTMIVESDGSSNARVLMYQRADGSVLSAPYVPLAGNKNMTGGVTATAKNLGNITSFTVDGLQGQLQYGTNHGAFTLTASTADTAVDLLITNDSSAGSITFSGFTVGSLTGDTLDTTNGHKFLISIRRINGVSTYMIKALQ